MDSTWPPNPLNEQENRHQRLREVIARSGIITPDQLVIALDYQAKTQRFLGQIIAEHKFADPKDIYSILGDYIRFPFLDLEATTPDPQYFKLLAKEEILAWESIVMGKEGKHIQVVMADPENLVLQDRIIRRIRDALGPGQQVRFYLADPRAIEKVLYKQNESKNSSKPESLDCVGYMDGLLQESVQLGASDIHIFPLEHGAEVRLRHDGVLKTYRTISERDLPLLINRIKVLAGLNIAQQRLPQSGGFRRITAGHDVDFRVSVHGTILGESIVVRILDKSKRLLNLMELGFSEDQIEKLKWAARQKSGLIICSGPTGAGKSSTLYALLNELNHDAHNIMTLEDPVEYQISTIRQTEIKPGTMNFSEGIRSMLRHDPDVMLIGEIRDAETAEAAIRASLTGHLVLTTLHAPTLGGIFLRLEELGISESQISSQVICAINQRLVRKVCRVCGGLECKKCLSTGYKGRTVLAEIVLLGRNQGIDDIQGSSLWQEGRNLVSHGITNEKELKRVLGEES